MKTPDSFESGVFIADHPFTDRLREANYCTVTDFSEDNPLSSVATTLTATGFPRVRASVALNLVALGVVEYTNRPLRYN